MGDLWDWNPSQSTDPSSYDVLSPGHSRAVAHQHHLSEEPSVRPGSGGSMVGFIALVMLGAALAAFQGMGLAYHRLHQAFGAPGQPGPFVEFPTLVLLLWAGYRAVRVPLLRRRLAFAGVLCMMLAQVSDAIWAHPYSDHKHNSTALPLFRVQVPLNVRSGPGTQFSVVRVLQQGDSIYVGPAYASGWAPAYDLHAGRRLGFVLNQPKWLRPDSVPPRAED